MLPNQCSSLHLSPVYICSVQGMSNEDIQNLQKVVDEQIQENLGMSMIYTIVSAAQEWMQEKVSGSPSQATCRNHLSSIHKPFSHPVLLSLYGL